MFDRGQNLFKNLRIIDVIVGGMAFVYILKDTQTGEQVVAKRLHEEFMNDSLMTRRFRREMRIWLGLGGHPNIVRALFMQDINSVPFLFMEHVDGGSLDELIQSSPPLPLNVVLRIAKGVAEGMEYVHNRITPDGLRGILHRDIKPSNILIDKTNEAKVADFGMARAVNATRLTRTSEVLGTLHYSSPEQILDPPSVDRRSDIYSFGASIYHALCGVPPFSDNSWRDLVGRIRSDVPPAPTELRKDVPGELSDLIMQCLAKKKEDRIDRFGEIIVRIYNMLSERNGIAEQASFDAARGFNMILDRSQEEAARQGRTTVGPVQLFATVLMSDIAPLTPWLTEAGVDEETFVSQLRDSDKNHVPKEPGEEVRFERSCRRVIGLAHSLAERDGLKVPQSKHLLQALLQESATREALMSALHNLKTTSKDLSPLFDSLEIRDG
jgi:serine/threonine protein kinase